MSSTVLFGVVSVMFGVVSVLFGVVSVPFLCSSSNEGKDIAERLKGHTPTFRNPATMVSGFIALYHAFAKRDEKENFVTTFPGFSAMNVWQTLDQCFFNGPKKLTSSGCAACVVCGGKHIIVTPLLAAKRTAYGVKWVEWPSRSRSTGR